MRRHELLILTRRLQKAKKSSNTMMYCRRIPSLCERKVSFRVGFVTRHLKHTDSYLVARVIGHKHIATTLRYNRYVVDEEKDREILSRGY